MKRSLGISSALWVVSGALLSCGQKIPTVPLGQHPMQGGALPVAVDVAPPPMRIENVPPQPNTDCLWADGRWRRWEGRWQWVPGAWLRPLITCYYAEPLLVWIPSVDGQGVLFHTDGEWYDRSSGRICPPPAACISRVRN